MFNINNISRSYDTNSTVSKKHNNFPIPNWLHAKFLLWGYDPITNDEYLLGETTDKRVARSWVKETHRDQYMKIIIEFPGSYYTTAHELRWCDAKANPATVYFTLNDKSEEIPF